MGDSPIVIVCTLEYERRRLAPFVRGRAEVLCAGPGAARVASCVELIAVSGTRRVILAGVAGGLRPTGVCPPIGKVVARDGRSWTPNVAAASEQDAATLLGVDHPVTEPDDKAALGVAHDADLVDCESHAFAACATRHDMAWGIVRGVSDGPRERLDPGVLRWTDERGATRVGSVLGDMARHPRLLGVAAGLARRSARAMRAVGARVDEILRTLERVPDG